MQILRTILIIVVVYYGFKFVMRLLAPYLLKKVVNKAQQNMNQQFGGQGQDRPEPEGPEGEVTIKQAPRSRSANSSADSNEGDYVDFEEIEE